MCKLAQLLLLGICTFCSMFTSQGGSDLLIGTVVSGNDTPVGGVKIFAWRDVTTDAEGRFELSTAPKKDSVVLFQKDGFRPKSLVVKAGTSTLKVVLEDDKKTAWLLPTCSSMDHKIPRKGGNLKFLLPRNATVRQIEDIDYREYVLNLVTGSKPLQLWYGPLVSPGQITSDLTLRSAGTEERSIHGGSGDIVGYDQRGRTQDGMMWRAADFSGLSASAIYEGVSEKDAIAYDRIIDSACQLDKPR